MIERSTRTSGKARPGEGESFETRPLDASTWEAFAELVERNNGVYVVLVRRPSLRGPTRRQRSPHAQGGAGQGWRAQAALVLGGDGLAQGWCQYGSAEELGLKHRREYEKDPPPPARWRIACIFVDRRHRGFGVARAGLAGTSRGRRVGKHAWIVSRGIDPASETTGTKES
jgi:hypothetical protein